MGIDIPSIWSEAWQSISTVEVLGFITGAICVWLLVKQHILNWPIGIANNVFFAVLFWRSRLYGDMALQFVYMVLGALGWYRWLHGGAQHSRLDVSRTPARLLIGIAAGGAVSTAALTVYLRSVGGSAPFLDALTTVMSVSAQYLMTKKYVENWLIWIAADAIYIGLYTQRSLYLTAVLYAIFLLMCIEGWRRWRRAL